VDPAHHWAQKEEISPDVVQKSVLTANIFPCCEMMAGLELLQQLFALLRKISVVHM